MHLSELDLDDVKDDDEVESAWTRRSGWQRALRTRTCLPMASHLLLAAMATVQAAVATTLGSDVDGAGSAIATPGDVTARTDTDSDSEATDEEYDVWGVVL